MNDRIIANCFQPTIDRWALLKRKVLRDVGLYSNISLACRYPKRTQLQMLERGFKKLRGKIITTLPNLYW